MHWYMDMAGIVHTEGYGNRTLVVPLVQMNAFLGLLCDVVAERVLSLDVEDAQKFAALRAVTKVLWIQNDLVSRHYTPVPDQADDA